MNTKVTVISSLTIVLILLAAIEARQTQDKVSKVHRSLETPPLSTSGSTSTVSTLLDRIRGVDKRVAKPDTVPTINDAVEEDDDEEEEFEEDEDEEGGEESEETTNQPLIKKPQVRAWTDMFGNQLKVDENRTTLVIQNKARDFGLLTIKALILGPLIGLTIKAALIRGLLWAIGAYLLHLFFPALLSTLGLGTGLVGFARQMQPNIAELVLPHLANFTMCAIDRSQGIAN